MGNLFAVSDFSFLFLVTVCSWNIRIIETVGIAHPKIEILPLFTHPQVVPILYEFLGSAEKKGRYFEECK